MLGFSAVFIALGASATALGDALRDYDEWITRVGGVLLIAFGADAARSDPASRSCSATRGCSTAPRPAAVRARRLGRRRRRLRRGLDAVHRPGAGRASSRSPRPAAEAGEGVALLAAYSLGLAIPFLAAAFAIDRFRVAARGRRRLAAMDQPRQRRPAGRARRAPAHGRNDRDVGMGRPLHPVMARLSRALLWRRSSLAGCGGSDEPARPEPTEGTAAPPGRELFATTCGSCHTLADAARTAPSDRRSTARPSTPPRSPPRSTRAAARCRPISSPAPTATPSHATWRRRLAGERAVAGQGPRHRLTQAAAGLRRAQREHERGKRDDQRRDPEDQRQRAVVILGRRARRSRSRRRRRGPPRRLRSRPPHPRRPRLRRGAEALTVVTAAGFSESGAPIQRTISPSS